MTASDRIKQLLDEYPNPSRVYIDFEPKPTGGYRKICKPNKPLRKWLRQMNAAMSTLYGEWPSFMHGGVKKRSYVSHAKPHTNKSCVITIDIEKCFDSITESEIRATLIASTDLSEEVCTRLASSLCYKGCLPQGFATSNFLCNLYLVVPLGQLYTELQSKNIVLTSYVDDLAVSGRIDDTALVVNQMILALSRAKLKTNKAKVLVMKSSQRQVVCGLIVNRRLSLTPQLKRKLMSDVAGRRMLEVSAEGWVSSLHNVDPDFGEKFKAYAVKKGLIKPKAP